MAVAVEPVFLWVVESDLCMVDPFLYGSELLHRQASSCTLSQGLVRRHRRSIQFDLARLL